MLERKVHGSDQQIEVFLESAALRRRRDAFAEDCQNRAFHRRGDGFVGGFHAAGHGFFESRQIGFFQVGQPLGDAGEDPGEDHAGVAAGAGQHAVGDGVRRPAESGRGGPAAGFHRHIHIVAGVSVGNREYIQVIDRLTVSVQRGGAAADQVEKAFSVEYVHHFSSRCSVRRKCFHLSSSRNMSGSRE